MSSKRLYRSIQDRKIGGVAGGLGEYLNVDSTFIRLIWILAIFSGVGIIAYIIAWIAIPEEKPAQVTVEPNLAEENPVPNATESSASIDNNDRQKRYSMIGLVLIAIGVFFLLKQFLPWNLSNYTLPAILIALGILLLIPRHRR